MKSNSKGQAMFEFIIFLPFVVVLFKMFLNIGGAINGSINQQKQLRGYFYYLNKGNSYFPDKHILENELKRHFLKLGSMLLVMLNNLKAKLPIAPCYKIEPFLEKILISV